MKVSQTLTSLFYLAILALLCVVQCKQEVDAPLPEVDLKKIADNEKPMDDGAVEPWIISFDSDLAETAHFDGVIKWLESNKCAITESVNESYIKFLVANMTKLNVKDLELEGKNWHIESIEPDDFVWDSLDKSEL